MRKRFLIFVGAFMLSFIVTQGLMAQDSKVVSEQTKTEESTGAKAINFIIGITVLGAFAGGIVYMVLVLHKKYYVEVTPKGMEDARLSNGMGPKATNDENAKAAELLENVLGQWHSFRAEDGETYYFPRRMVHVKRSVALINEAKTYFPTDQTVIDRMNELGGIINDRTKRSFAGSWSLLVVSFLVLLFFYFVGSGQGSFVHKIFKLWWLWGSMAFYIMASFAPQFLIEKRMEWFGGKKFSSGLINTVLAIVAATPVSYTVVTHWSDGTKTKSEEGTGAFIGIVLLALFALIIIGTCIIFFGIINFIRNYLLFF
jgi:hypothetical protein